MRGGVWEAAVYGVLGGGGEGWGVVCGWWWASVAQTMTDPTPHCSRCNRDDQPLLEADAGLLCLACVEEVGEAAGVDAQAVAVLRLLVGAKEP